MQTQTFLNYSLTEKEIYKEKRGCLTGLLHMR